MQHVLKWKEPCLALQQSMCMMPRARGTYRSGHQFCLSTSMVNMYPGRPAELSAALAARPLLTLASWTLACDALSQVCQQSCQPALPITIPVCPPTKPKMTAMIPPLASFTLPPHLKLFLKLQPPTSPPPLPHRWWEMNAPRFQRCPNTHPPKRPQALTKFAVQCCARGPPADRPVTPWKQVWQSSCESTLPIILLTPPPYQRQNQIPPTSTSPAPPFPFPHPKALLKLQQSLHSVLQSMQLSAVLGDRLLTDLEIRALTCDALERVWYSSCWSAFPIAFQVPNPT